MTGSGFTKYLFIAIIVHLVIFAGTSYKDIMAGFSGTKAEESKTLDEDITPPDEDEESSEKEEGNLTGSGSKPSGDRKKLERMKSEESQPEKNEEKEEKKESAKPENPEKSKVEGDDIKSFEIDKPKTTPKKEEKKEEKKPAKPAVKPPDDDLFGN